MTALDVVRVRIILSPDNGSWIIEKMAQRLAQFCSAFGVEADVAAEPNPQAHLNHWMSYAFANVDVPTPTTMLITHLDDPYKIRLVQQELAQQVDIGICLSSHTMQLLTKEGVSPSKIAYVVPGHDFAPTPRPIVIGLTTRLYADGRKRESMLVRLAKRMSLEDFRFEIFGSGWERVIPKLEEAGALVDYYPGTADYQGDYSQMLAHISNFDYYLYLGRDEGSLGTLDALAAGVKTIVTPQGFHVDLPNGITHSVWGDDDLLQTFQKIASDRTNRINAVAALSWENYAREHSAIWRAVVAGQPIDIPARFRSESENLYKAPKSESKWAMQIRLLSPYRIRSAISHLPFLKPVRTRILAKRRRRANKP